MRAIQLLAPFAVACLLYLPRQTSALEAGSPAASQSVAASAAAALPGGPARKWVESLPNKETLAAMTALVALLGTTVPLITKGMESVSLSSRRRKDLQRIEDLTGLLEKIKKENILTIETQAEVCSQIEAEIKAALSQLSKNRERREKALAEQHRAQETKAAKVQLELPMWRRVLLLYLPQGVAAWIAHGFIYLWLPLGLLSLVLLDWVVMSFAAILVAGPYAVAWRRRRQWEAMQKLPAPVAAEPQAQAMALGPA